MTIVEFLKELYLLALLVISVIGIIRFCKVDQPTRLIILMVWLGLVTELTAFFVARIYRNNLPVYNLYSFLEFGILCFYFNQVIDRFRKVNAGFAIGAGGIFLGSMHLIWSKQFDIVNTYFFFFEGIIIIVLSLLYCFQAVEEFDGSKLFHPHYFWFSVILASLYSINFLTWGLYDYFTVHLKREVIYLNYGLLVTNIIAYGFIGLLVFRYPKQRTSYV